MPMIKIKQTTSLLPRHEREGFLCNATSSAILLYLIFQFVIILGVTFVGGFLTAIYTNRYFVFYHSSLTTITNIASIVSTIGGMGLATFMVKNILKIKFPSLKPPKLRPSHLFYYTFVAIGLSSLIGFVVTCIRMLLGNVGVELITPNFTMQYDVLNNLLIFASTCIVAPILEELLFRGLILTALRRFGNMYAILITSLLFALVHGNIPQSVPTFFISLVLCYVVIRTKSLFPAIFIHFFNNIISIMELYFSNNEQISLVFVCFEIALIIYSIVMIIRKRKLIISYVNRNKGTSIRSYFKHIAPILVLLFCFISIYMSLNI